MTRPEVAELHAANRSGRALPSSRGARAQASIEPRSMTPARRAHCECRSAGFSSSSKSARLPTATVPRGFVRAPQYILAVEYLVRRPRIAKIL